MSETQTILDQQKQIGKELKQRFSNFNKDGPDKNSIVRDQTHYIHRKTLENFRRK